MTTETSQVSLEGAVTIIGTLSGLPEPVTTIIQISGAACCRVRGWRLPAGGGDVHELGAGSMGKKVHGATKEAHGSLECCMEFC